jgi:CxxC motif-containing protein (DUF1111 family)
MAAVTDEEIIRIAEEQAARGDQITGEINWVAYQSRSNPDQEYHSHEEGDEGLVGRFGLKSQFATLDDFTADAYQGDMSITSPMRPEELSNPDSIDDDYFEGVDIDRETVNITADYVRLLEIPERDIPIGNGEVLFTEVGCNVCHTPTLRTYTDYPVALLADIDAPIYSDMLLHDMGDSSADGMIQFNAGSTEWRTAPLIGLRFLRSYMHDGRAATVEEAILAHRDAASEAIDIIDNFENLSASDQTSLVDFVSSL